jgi:hypothetical protein
MLLAPITDIFCDIDDFYKQHLSDGNNKILPNPERRRQREGSMSVSEIMTILVLFHISHYRTFKNFYLSCVLEDLSSEFPMAVSYSRFVFLIPTVLEPLTAYVLSQAGEKTNYYYVDSTKLVVCHNKRISRNKVFKGIAKRGKSSMGWFFGFKLHLVINQKGELINFCLTKGNIDDRKVVPQIMKNLSGLAAGDKGYLGEKLSEELQQHDLKLITKENPTYLPFLNHVILPSHNKLGRKK